MSWIFVYKIIFMTELLIAEIMLTFHYPTRKGIAYFMPLAIFICYGTAILYPHRFVDNWFSSSLMFLSFFAVSIACLKLCYRVKLINIIFCAVAAYTVQHLAYIIFSLINITLFDSQAFISNVYGNDVISLSGIGGMMAFSFVAYVILYFIVYLISQTILKRWVGKNGNLTFKSVTVLGFVALTLIVDVVISDVFRYTDANTRNQEFFYCVLSVLLCLCLLCLQMSMIKSKDVEQEMAILSHLYDEQRKHYQIRKETIDMINIKCHDFRHQIHEMGSNRGVDDDVLKKMQELISFYDADIKTGNKSLDIILTEKNLLCCKKNIDFTCIVDGKLLSFIKDSDLYALLGNILDNAIEAVDNVPDQTKRCINFIVEKKCGAVTVCENNYYSGEIVKDGNGVIVTKKADELRHGFGLKSIREITSRYDGIFDIDTEKDIFRLSIVFFGR